ncbi:hypothetical protein AgCh_031889 [Apium graveolens]
MGHIAKICWWVPKRSTRHSGIPQALAALTLDNPITETEWTSDTGASNHMTGKSETSSTPVSSLHDPTLFHENGDASTTTHPVKTIQSLPDQSSSTELDITTSQSSQSSEVPLPPLAYPGWKATMMEELAALHNTRTWKLVSRTSKMHVIGSKWVFKTKLKPDGTLDRLKARLAEKGYHQIDGVDYTETFSPVIKPGTIRIVITLALVRQWPIRQLDVGLCTVRFFTKACYKIIQLLNKEFLIKDLGRSTTGYYTFLGSNIISWCAKKQHTISRSSTGAEYRAKGNIAAQLTWLTFLLKDLQIPISSHQDSIVTILVLFI